MEEVWKDIGLTMSDEVILPHQSKHQHHPMIFQDFFSKQGQSNNAALSSSRTAVSPSPPPTMLTLTSAAARGGPTLIHQSPRDVYSQNNYDQHPLNGNVPLVEGLNVNNNNNNNIGKQKRFSDADGNSAVRRHKRLVKNRESAARSRARKQAYTNELEHEVAQLMEENARLKEQQQQLETAAASVATHQHERKRSLCRTSTAPF